MLPESVESALSGKSAVKHGVFIIDVLSLAQSCLLHGLPHSNEIPECFNKTCTKLQINTVCAKNVDIYSNVVDSTFVFVVVQSLSLV